ncbi:IS1595 family transposase [Mesorhizobium sp. WSM4306]|uniref:IS1595 family transposase n=1 Tax=Mesorhizobium sp. WSM4306 TaxID=2589885 RepID=UPI00115CF8EF|nr:IS1595 family transposase [Mesorhizobium sp. WSM4306]TRC98271.1 IS1595 family transposase [Mesorhizobium sp. WSM4306]
MTDLQNPIFTDEDKAREALEAVRWPNGPYCPHCGNANPDKIALIEGKKHSHRPGLRYCNECKGQFTVTVGTVFERSKIPLSKWWLATHLLGASKKGMSAHQLQRMLGVTYKTAWFMAHRIREAMKEDVKSSGPIGGEGKIVEADETYFGPKDRVVKRTIRGKPSNSSKRSIVALVERGGSVRSFHVERATKEAVRDVLVRNADRKSTLMTDESNFYPITGQEFADHATVKHTGGEYVRYEADRIVHTNTIENVFSVFKRGMVGVYQHCGEAHFHRYLAEFDFRYNRRAKLGYTDQMRVDAIMEGIEGKRLTYRSAH